MELTQRLRNVVEFYTNALILKNCERSGWKQWGISRDKRVESIAEHIYGTQQLDIAMYSEFNIPVNIFKVLTMLALHETEEIKIGDITCCDGISEEEKLKMGSKAVDEVYEGLHRRDKFIQLIDEFNARETLEAKFAYCCDKMECDLMVKLYSYEGRFTIHSAVPHVADDENVKKYIASGAKTVADIFFMNDVHKYDEMPEFRELFKFIASNEVRKIM